MQKMLRIIIFLMVLVFLISRITPWLVMANKDVANNVRSTGAKIKDERRNSIDVVFIGDSEAYSSFSPLRIWQTSGITSYVAAGPGFNLLEVHDELNKVLKYQRPRYVFLETDAIFAKISVTKPLEHYVTSKVGILKYHDNWKKWLGIQHSNLTKNNCLKGYHRSKVINGVYPKNYMRNQHKKQTISPANQYQLDAILKTCQKYKSQLVLISTPSPVNWNYAKHLAIATWAKKQHLEYIDLNLQELGIDWSRDTRDRGDHLNDYGADKVSGWMADYLAEHTMLIDKRCDPVYSGWNQLSELFR